MRPTAKVQYHYSELYKQKVFDAWFLAGRPSIALFIEEYLPEENGNKPSYSMIVKWREEFGWEWRADELDARAVEKSNDELIMRKVEMLKRHHDDAVSLANKAKEHLLEEGFDSSAAAVNAYFRGTEEQRKIQGFGELFEKLSKMPESEIQSHIIGLLNRANANDQTLEDDIIINKEDNLQDDDMTKD